MDNSRLYATHTGGSSSVSIFDISDAHSQQPMFIKSIQTDANPFGLAAVPAVPEPTGGILWSLALIFASSRRRS